MKKISSFFDALPSRKRPATAEDPKADLQCSQEDHVMQHQEKRSAINAQEIFNRAARKHIHGCDSLKEKMYCATCVDSYKSAERLASPNSTFVTGTDNFRLDSIRSHESSIPHIQVTKAFMFRCNPEKAPLPRALAAVSEEVQLKMNKLFEVAYFVAKLELPFTVYESIVSLEKKHGVKLGQTYHNDKACKNFITGTVEQFDCDLSGKVTVQDLSVSWLMVLPI